MTKEALLIIDMLNDFVCLGAPLEVPNARKIIPAIKREIEEARKNSRQVIYVCDAHEPDDKEFVKFGWPSHAVKGTKGAEIVEELMPDEDDIIINKTTYSGFYNTQLNAVLKKIGINSLRLTGCVTHICIMFTASDAVLRGYNVSVVKDAVAGLKKQDHEAALRIMKNVLGIKLI